MYRLHANDSLAEDAMKLLEDSEIFEITTGHYDKEELKKNLEGIEFLVVRSATKVTADVLSAGKELKVVGRAGVGLDNVDVETAKKLGIQVYNTPGANAISVAELTMGLLLSLVRHIPRGTAGLKENLWEKKKLKGNEIYGKTLGLIGYGAIGKEVAKRALAFGMNIIVYDPYVESTDMDIKLCEDIEAMLPEVDVLSLHVPLNNKTKHIISKKELDLIKDGALVINAARGGVLDEQALYDAIISEKVKAAALDVFEVEPPNDELRRKLLGLDNVIATPHIGASTVEGQVRVGIEMAKKLIEVGKKL
ncbi:MAG: hydroxyacid dehydrogenase [Kosmotogaceae bacterium]